MAVLLAAQDVEIERLQSRLMDLLSARFSSEQNASHPVLCDGVFFTNRTLLLIAPHVCFFNSLN